MIGHLSWANGWHFDQKESNIVGRMDGILIKGKQCCNSCMTGRFEGSVVLENVVEHNILNGPEKVRRADLVAGRLGPEPFGLYSQRKHHHFVRMRPTRQCA